MTDPALLAHLRRLVTDLQGAPSGKMDDWQRGQTESYSLGFDDGQIQAGNDLEALLDEHGRVERRPDS